MTDDELKRLFDTLRQETRGDFGEAADRLAKESRHQFEIAVEHFDKRFNLLAESIANVDEKLVRKSAAIEERMERGFADTQAMIKFSHDELDKRVRALEQSQHSLDQSRRTLEESLAELRIRVQRLESSTH